MSRRTEEDEAVKRFRENKLWDPVAKEDREELRPKLAEMARRIYR